MRAEHIGFVATAVGFSFASAAVATAQCTCAFLVQSEELVCIDGPPFAGNCGNGSDDDVACTSNAECFNRTGGFKPVCIVNLGCTAGGALTSCQQACAKGLVCSEAGAAQTFAEFTSGNFDCEEPSIPPPPPPPPPVPAVSGWGMAALGLLLLAGLTFKFRGALLKRA